MFVSLFGVYHRTFWEGFFSGRIAKLVGEGHMVETHVWQPEGRPRVGVSWRFRLSRRSRPSAGVCARARSSSGLAARRHIGGGKERGILAPTFERSLLMPSIFDTNVCK